MWGLSRPYILYFYSKVLSFTLSTSIKPPLSLALINVPLLIPAPLHSILHLEALKSQLLKMQIRSSDHIIPGIKSPQCLHISFRAMFELLNKSSKKLPDLGCYLSFHQLHHTGHFQSISTCCSNHLNGSSGPQHLPPLQHRPTLLGQLVLISGICLDVTSYRKPPPELHQVLLSLYVLC